MGNFFLFRSEWFGSATAATESDRERQRATESDSDRQLDRCDRCDRSDSDRQVEDTSSPRLLSPRLRQAATVATAATVRQCDSERQLRQIVRQERQLRQTGLRRGGSRVRLIPPGARRTPDCCRCETALYVADLVLTKNYIHTTLYTQMLSSHLT